MSDAAIEFYHQAARGTTKQVSVNTSTNGDTIVVSGTEGKRILLFSIFLMAGAAVTVTWKSNQNEIIGPAPLAANGGYHLTSERVVAATNDGEDLIINLNATASVGGVISYASIPA